MSLLGRLVEFVAGRSGGDDLGSFIAGQPSVSQSHLSLGLFHDRKPGRYQRFAQHVENYPGDLDE
jgi:hypothetical protein